MTMHHLLGESVFDVEGDDAWGATFFVMHAVVGGRTMSSFGRYVAPTRGMTAEVAPGPPLTRQSDAVLLQMKSLPPSTLTVAPVT
jgi:hypothetical protein